MRVPLFWEYAWYACWFAIVFVAALEVFVEQIKD